MRTAPRYTCDDAARLAAEVYGIAARAEPLPSERDQNFRLWDAGAQFILKISNRQEERAILELQNEALRRLTAGGTGLEWARVVRDRRGREIAEAGGHFVRLLTWVEGECFANVRPHSPELLSSLGRGLGRIDTALADFDHPAAHRTHAWDLRHAETAWEHAGRLPEARRGLVEPLIEAWQRVDWSGFRTSIIHGDANDYNVLVNAGPRGHSSHVVGIVDLGDMLRTATVCELAIALAYAMLGERDPIAAGACVARAYHAEYPLTDSEIAALYTLSAARLAMSVCHAAWQTAEAPGNEYLNISNASAWAAIEALSKLPAGWADEVFRRACAGPMRDLADARRAHLGPSLSLSYREPLHIIRGWRQHLYDASGRAYLDCVNNVAHVGHCHPRVVAAEAGQAALLNTNTRYLHENLNEYLARLAATLPPPLSVIYLVCSGSEANELALRLARAHTGSDRVIVVDIAYHGNTSALVDISPYKFNGPGGRGKSAHVTVVPVADEYRSVRWRGTVAEAAAHTGAAAFFCESALGCGGQVILPRGYLREAYEAVRAAGGVSIADEVQTGFGRAGTNFWMFETQGVVPDIVTMGKPIGNGHPIGAVATTAEIAASFANGMEYFNTFGGNPVSCAVGLAVLDAIRDEGLQENARATGEYLLGELRQLAERHRTIGDVRGQGLFLGIELVRDRGTKEPAAEEASELVNRMKELGVLLSTDGPFHNVIKIKPPLVFSRDDAGVLVSRLEEALAVPPFPHL